MHLRPTFLAWLPLAVGTVLTAGEPPRLTPAQILGKVTVPPEFAATVFAAPPDIGYPVFLSAAADGTVFVACDENGSLDRQPGRGRVVMCRDTDGDGRADAFSTFARVDSPRGVAWDAATRTLYVMHPPHLTAYHDDQGVGVANRQEDLVKDLGFGLDFRGADHTTNGIRLGIDGWIYVAVGDYGAVKATGRDGRTLELRGGGVARVRPDGTGLELAVRGTRNILAVAVSPTLDLFTRDNTNDGDDWNDRLSFLPVGAHMGYPTLYRNFADETIPAMIDFGGGSPVGAVYIDEPALPAAWSRGFFSVEWGRSEIDLHPLTAKGAGWSADTRQMMKLPRPTDLDVDGSARLYASSWDGASFTYVGPNVGYVLRLAAKDAKPAPVPEFARLDPVSLARLVGSPSAVWRFAAQRELLKRGPQPGVDAELAALATGSDHPGVRVAAVFTLRLLNGRAAYPRLLSWLDRDDLREAVLKAVGDEPSLASAVPAGPLVTALADANPRVRLQAVTSLGRLGKSEAAREILPLTADADPVVAHVAIAALRSLAAVDACWAALDSADARLHPGALRVLQAIQTPAVVDGLLQRLPEASGPRRRGILATLARLNFREAAFTDPKQWWGTRPDTSGPVYKPERWERSAAVEAALKRALEQAQGDDAKALVVTLMRTKVTFPGFADLMLAKAGHDTATRLDLIAPLVSPKAPAPAELLSALSSFATNPDERVEHRARALRILGSLLEKNGDAVIAALAPLALQPPAGELGAVWEELTRDPRNARRAGYFAGLAKESDPARRALGATVLVHLVTSPMVREERQKKTASNGLDALWKNPEQALTLLEVIGRTRAAALAPAVRERLVSSDARVAAAARLTLAGLGVDETPAEARRPIGELAYDDAVRQAVALPGDPKRGQELWLQAACFACHTVSPNEPPKGPMLGGIAQRYNRTELCESILRPSARIAQGFESQYFKLRNGSETEGFVVREGGDSVDVRTLAGTTSTIEKGDIAVREKREKSIMPEGLMNALTPVDLASLLAFLETTGRAAIR